MFQMSFKPLGERDPVFGDRSMEKVQHWRAFVQVEPDVAVRFRRRSQRLLQGGHGRRLVALGMMGECLKHADLDQASIPPRFGRCGVQPVQEEQSVDRGRCAGSGPVASGCGAVLGEQEPHEGEVLVLAQVVRVVADAHVSVL